MGDGSLAKMGRFQHGELSYYRSCSLLQTQQEEVDLTSHGFDLAHGYYFTIRARGRHVFLIPTGNNSANEKAPYLKLLAYTNGVLLHNSLSNISPFLLKKAYLSSSRLSYGFLTAYLPHIAVLFYA